MTTNSSETAPEIQQAGHTAEAVQYLARAATHCTEDAGRQVLAQIGIGQALLALGDTLDSRLADIAGAVTGVHDQVGYLCEVARPARRWPWGRGRSAARPLVEAADMPLLHQALADAAAWCRIDECGAVVDNERRAFAYLELRERLGGGAS